jgi:hypothetical protein
MENSDKYLAGQALTPEEKARLEDEEIRTFESRGDIAPLIRRLSGRPFRSMGLSVIHEDGALCVLDAESGEAFQVRLVEGTPDSRDGSRWHITLLASGASLTSDPSLEATAIVWEDAEHPHKTAFLEGLLLEVAPQSGGWNLQFVSRQVEPHAGVQRGLYASSHGAVRMHERRADGGLEIAVEIDSPRRIIEVFLQSGEATVTGEPASLPF